MEILLSKIMHTALLTLFSTMVVMISFNGEKVPFWVCSSVVIIFSISAMVSIVAEVVLIWI